MKNEYQQQAIDFLNSVGATMRMEYLGKSRPRWDETHLHNHYQVTIRNKAGVSWSFDFWDSLANTELCDMTDDDYARKSRHMNFADLPGTEKHNVHWELRNKKKDAELTEYEVLSCLTTYDVGTFEDFCDEFGYSTDSRKTEQTYFAVQDEYNHMHKLFSNIELLQLSEIL